MNIALYDCLDFVRRVRRRMVMARAARRILLSLAISGGAAAAVMAIMTMLGQPPLPIMSAIVSLGLLAGLAWAFWRIPAMHCCRPVDRPAIAAFRSADHRAHARRF